MHGISSDITSGISYDIIWAVILRTDIRAYLLFDDHPEINIIVDKLVIIDAIFFSKTLLASSLKKRPDSIIFISLWILDAARKKHAQITNYH